ncbi:T9SS type A sorting domain-containing protein [Dysgonomonas sp. 520]|uniref:T9SS type A sorting domain-containing protein n=1 Tax=Dysgonomonas sp. 520 TaxID=2302931 RepID=UPI0013D52A2C|nr:T9SS type A sorting domain-containing protein [Dysgonomonas sp. 520]NDW08126.1 T9SS C-terminal target domain-containing protein [Dysgonomonas sp. 520]
MTIVVLLAWWNVKPMQAQDVFPTSDAIWSVYVYSYEPTKHFIYGLSGDTIINEQTYQKLYLLNDSTLSIDESDVYIGGIRQNEKIVYLKPADNIYGTILEEYILYDFSKRTGEKVLFGRFYTDPYYNEPTLKHITETSNNIDDIIEKDEIVNLGRMIQLKETREKWIEGIGSLSGFFFSPITYPLDGSGKPLGGSLICMKEKNKVKYSNLEHCGTCFDSPVNSIVINNINNQINVKYNENTKSLEIHNTINDVFFKLIMYNINGLKTKAIESNISTSIDLSNCARGIYIYQIIGENISQKGIFITH